VPRRSRRGCSAHWPLEANFAERQRLVTDGEAPTARLSGGEPGLDAHLAAIDGLVVPNQRHHNRTSRVGLLKGLENQLGLIGGQRFAQDEAPLTIRALRLVEDHHSTVRAV
jgi:hypothetical protein